MVQSADENSAKKFLKVGQPSPPPCQNARMKNENQNTTIENQTIIFEPVPPYPQPVLDKIIRGLEIEAAQNGKNSGARFAIRGLCQAIHNKHA